LPPPSRAAPGPAPPQRARRHRHLDRPLAAHPPQGPHQPLRLRSAPALRGVGGYALPRQPREGAGAVRRALSPPRRAHRLRAAPADSALRYDGDTRGSVRSIAGLEQIMNFFLDAATPMRYVLPMFTAYRKCPT